MLVAKNGSLQHRIRQVELHMEFQCQHALRKVTLAVSFSFLSAQRRSHSAGGWIACCSAAYVRSVGTSASAEA